MQGGLPSAGQPANRISLLINSIWQTDAVLCPEDTMETLFHRMRLQRRSLWLICPRFLIVHAEKAVQPITCSGKMDLPLLSLMEQAGEIGRIQILDFHTAATRCRRGVDVRAGYTFLTGNGVVNVVEQKSGKVLYTAAAKEEAVTWATCREEDRYKKNHKEEEVCHESHNGTGGAGPLGKK